ncbi:MAG: hypothetical protein ABR608_02915 [Pseudonocardiaceae bacterium]
MPRRERRQWHVHVSPWASGTGVWRLIRHAGHPVAEIINEPVGAE